MAHVTDPRIDAYIDEREPFAQPILRHLRQLIAAAVPEVVETTKWGMPFFEYRGVLCGMAAFKRHATFTIWKGHLIPEVAALYAEQSNQAMGTFGRIGSLEELPADEQIVDWLRQAAELNVRNVKVPQRTRFTARPEATPSDDFASALDGNETARVTFEALSPSQRREYVEWIEEAKTDSTRQKRLATAIEQLSEGKARHWKYQKGRNASEAR